jgi:hypothetical protein
MQKNPKPNVLEDGDGFGLHKPFGVDKLDIGGKYSNSFITSTSKQFY